MKESTVVALHKAGDTSEPSNYRPVSLTPIIAKVMESIMHDNLLVHIENNQLIHESQHGFRKNHSTTTNLIYFWNDITNYANKKNEISIIYTDLRKAFDSVPHDLLLFKLSKLGIQNENFQWFASFLENRQQAVRINDSSSIPIHAASGVPQGGVLSGTLFNLFIGDMVHELKYLKASLYADDAKFYGPVHDSQSKLLIQEDINRVVDWCDRWRLRLNTSKCFFIHYRPPRSTGDYPTYFIGEDELQRRQSGRDLGVTVSENLKLHEQVQRACKEATKQINIIRRTFVSRNPEFLANMFKMHVRPKLEYCAPMWNPTYSGDIQRLEKVQNRFTRLLPNARTMTPAERNRRLGITSHETRRLRGDLIHMFKLSHDTSLFPRCTDPRTRGHSKKLQVPRMNNDLRKHSFAVRNVPTFLERSTRRNCKFREYCFKSRIDYFFSENEMFV